jgi:hypothetical protein
MIISTEAEKASVKIHHPFITEALKRQELERTFLNIISAIYNKLTSSIILNGEN